MVKGRTWWVILVLGLVALGIIPLMFTTPSWKLGLAACAELQPDHAVEGVARSAE